ncbi:MAG: hypothetical protein JXR03_20195 [Cyclobacteriaceae bacterium]
MDQLRQDWLTEGLIDFEYKKYVLLAYLKSIKRKFRTIELFPYLSDLILHYRNLEVVRNSKQVISDSFPKVISKADFQKLQISYESMVRDDKTMEELESIIMYAIERLTDVIGEGKEVHQFVEENVELLPVGISSTYEKEGYLFIRRENSKTISIYRYQVALFESATDKYRGISTTYINDERISYSKSYEKVKLSLSKRFNDLPSPATYLLLSKMKFPEKATLLPLAKRLLVQYISAA